MAEVTMQKMLDRFKLKLIKKEDDGRKSFRGELFITPRDKDHDGTEYNGKKTSYCIIPAHDADYVKSLCANMGYECSDPFIPGLDDKKKKETADKE